MALSSRQGGRSKPLPTKETTVNRTTHPLVEVLETADWILLDCPMCAGQLVRVWHSSGRMERLDRPSIDRRVAHWWVRGDATEARRSA